MIAAEFLASLKIPADARVDQRVPKKLLIEQGAPTAADRRAIQDGIEEMIWVAALKPVNCGVPAFRDDTREYVEIAILTAAFRPKSKRERLTELIHRAIPYPLLLLTEQDGVTNVSVAHIRSSLGQSGKTVLSDDVVRARVTDDLLPAYAAAIALDAVPRTDMFALYDAWVAATQALQAASLTGSYKLPQDVAQLAAQRDALASHARLTREIAELRARAAKETQINRRVDLNLAIQRLEGELAAVTTKL